MGFYFRRGFGFGPFRINLSKSGIGESVGVRGFRIGRTPKGKEYVRAGMGGLYYYKTLPSSSGLTSPTPSTAGPPGASTPAVGAQSLPSGTGWLDDSNVRFLESEAGQPATSIVPPKGEGLRRFLVIVLLSLVGLVAAITAVVFLIR